MRGKSRLRLLIISSYSALVLASLIFCAAIFAVEFDINNNNYHKNHPPSDKYTNQELSENVFGVGAEGWTAIFTAILAVATIALFVATYALFKLAAGERDKAEEALQVARDSAEAVKLQARASVNVELPKIVLSHVRLDRIGASNLKGRLQTPRVSVSVKNFGRSPAFITKSCADLWIESPLPEQPRYANIITEPADKIVESGDGLPLDKARILMLSEEIVDAIYEGRRLLWVFGFVSYRDFLNEPHEARFCKCFFRVDGTDKVIWYDGPTAVPDEYRKSY